MTPLTLSAQTVSDSPKAVSLRIAGDADTTRQDRIRAYFDEVLQTEQPRHVLLDLSGLTFAGTDFLSNLIVWKEEMVKKQGQLILFGLRREFASTVRIVMLDKVLTIRPDLNAALAALPRKEEG